MSSNPLVACLLSSIFDVSQRIESGMISSSFFAGSAVSDALGGHNLIFGHGQGNIAKIRIVYQQD